MKKQPKLYCIDIDAKVSWGLQVKATSVPEAKKKAFEKFKKGLKKGDFRLDNNPLF